MKKITTSILLALAFLAVGQTAPYSQNFDAVTAPALPSDWSFIASPTSAALVVETNTTYYVSASNSVVLSGNSGFSGATTMLISPLFTDLDQYKQIKFKAKRVDSSALSVHIGTMTDPSDASTYVELDNIALGSLTEVWTEFTFTFDTWNSANGNYIVIKQGQESVTGKLLIDDFVYEDLPCHFNAPYSENFDGVTTPALPTCWTFIASPTSAALVVETNTTYYVSASNSVVLSGNSGFSGATTMLISPLFTDLDQYKQIKFKAKRADSSALSVHIGTMTDPSDASTYVELDNIALGSLTEVWTEFTFTFDTWNSANGNYIVVKQGQESVTGKLLIDDFVYEQDPTAAIEEINENKALIYPNPTKDNITIKTVKNIQNIVIYNTLGQVIKTIKSNQNEINISFNNFKKGFYFIEISTNNKKEVIKLQKK